MQYELSFILVNYNTKQLCSQCIESIIRETNETLYEIIVVDNSSKQEERYTHTDCKKTIQILSGVENKGFGHACNLGARHACGKLLLFLNTDTIITSGAVDAAVRHYRQCSGIGILGIRTLLENGEFDHGCKRGFPTPLRSLAYFLKLDVLFPKSNLLGGYRLTYLDPSQTHDVECVSGAFMLIEKRLFDALCGFDEIFFMYGEDIDLCYRIKQLGYKVVYYAGAYIYHLKGQSGLHKKDNVANRHFYISMKLFYDKHYKAKYSRCTTWVVYQGIRLLCWKKGIKV